MKIEDCKKGTRVTYKPDRENKHGVVKRTHKNIVFVIYDQNDKTMVTGNEPYTAAATNPEDLIKWVPPEESGIKV